LIGFFINWLFGIYVKNKKKSQQLFRGIGTF